MSWFKALQGALQVIAVAPVLLQASLSIADGLEDAIEGPSKGKEKRDLAMAAMSLSLDTADRMAGDVLPKESLLGMFGGMLDLAVGTYNVVGKFTK